MSTQTDESVDVGVDIDAEVPCCLPPGAQCGRPAVWRVRIFHVPGGEGCVTLFGCAQHMAAFAEAYRQCLLLDALGAPLLCVPHGAPGRATWTKL